MGLNVGRGDLCSVSCDDPRAMGCVAKTKKMHGQNEIRETARQQGWFNNETTGKWTCPPCLSNEDHDVRGDFVGTGLGHSRPRLTCYTPVCNGATLVAQPYMTQEIWNKKYDDFRATHPSQDIPIER